MAAIAVLVAAIAVLVEAVVLLVEAMAVHVEAVAKLVAKLVAAVAVLVEAMTVLVAAVAVLLAAMAVLGEADAADWTSSTSSIKFTVGIARVFGIFGSAIPGCDRKCFSKFDVEFPFITNVDLHKLHCTLFVSGNLVKNSQHALVFRDILIGETIDVGCSRCALGENSLNNKLSITLYPGFSPRIHRSSRRRRSRRRRWATFVRMLCYLLYIDMQKTVEQ